MVFITHKSEKRRSAASALLHTLLPARATVLGATMLGATVLGATVLGACSSESGNFGFTIEDVSARWRNDILIVTTKQQLTLSSEAREALVHGVSLTIDMQLEVGGDDKQTTRFEVRYLPLSDHYQVSRPHQQSVRTYPRLRHVLAYLAEVEIAVRPEVLRGHELELRVRSHLNRRKVPAPMRLPVLFSAQWNHDSGWVPLTIQAPNS